MLFNHWYCAKCAGVTPTGFPNLELGGNHVEPLIKPQVVLLNNHVIITSAKLIEESQES